MRTSQKTRERTSGAYLERVNLAVDHIATHLEEPLSLKKLARAARFSPFHFHRVFQAIVGETPGDFVKRLRLERAVFMMARERRRGRRLARIAGACGFASLSDFSRSFKRRFGAAPSAFDLEAWRGANRGLLEAALPRGPAPVRLLPPLDNPDGFSARVRDVPARTVAYVRVANPYRGDAVTKAAGRLVAWAEERGLADGPWLGYQWENPELVPLEQCRYHVGLVAERFVPEGEVGRFAFPAMTVAEVEVRGDIMLELRALYWLYGAWLARSGYVPDDHPCFEAWIGRPFAGGVERFELVVQLPVRRG